MAQTPEQTSEIGLISISCSYPNLKLELNLQVDHPAVNHATDDERNLIKLILAATALNSLRVVGSREDLELVGRSVFDELFYMSRLPEIMQGRIESARISATAKRADESMEARKQNPPQ